MSCGWDIDWNRGLAGLPRAKDRPDGLSGAVLAKVIEGQIIPKLLLAHSDVPTARGEQKRLVPVLDSQTFAQLVLISEPRDIVEHVFALMDSGVKLEQIYLDLLSPVARMLGVLWEEDRCTFTDVTLGLSRLHQVLHEVGRRRSGAPVSRTLLRAHFAPVPGEQHTFGLSMLGEFFRHAGWFAGVDHVATEDSILATVKTQDLDLIGFSIGCVEFLDPLSDLIRRTREASCNREIVIMVGGRLFVDFPELATKLEAQAVITDGVDAVRIADKIVSEVSRNRDAVRLI
jgi:methanogenic corrinoid protein MtbC1